MAGRGPGLFSDLSPVKYTDAHRHGSGPLCPAGANRKTGRANNKAKSKSGNKSPKQEAAEHTGERKTKSAPLPMSGLELLEFMVCFKTLLELGALAQELVDAQTKNWGGRNREYRAIDALVFELATWVFPSYTSTENNLADEKNWNRLWLAVANAHPDRPDWWISPTPVSRDQHYRFRTGSVGSYFIEKMKTEIRAAAAEAGIDIGVLVPEGKNSMTRPNVFMAGDGTFIRSLFKTPHTKAVDPKTGKTRRTDPEAGTYRGKKREGYGGPGYTAVLLSARSPHGNERIIFDVGLQSGGKGEETEANLATRMFLSLIDDHPTEFKYVRGLIYDMALRSQDQERLLDAGKIPLVKIPYKSDGDPAWRNLGPCTFQTDNGQTTQQVVYAVNGTPSILGTDGNGVQWYVPLRRKQTKKEGEKGKLIRPGIRGGSLPLKEDESYEYKCER